jgi:hypothetical protein
MSNAKNELFLYLAAAFATLFGLFVLHRGYAAIVDLNYHKRLQQAGPSENVTAARQADAAALEKGKLPLDQAIARLGRGRATIGSVAPQPSQDLSAISGWIYHPGFKPAVAHPIRVPRPAAATPPKATEPPAANVAPGAATQPTTAQPQKPDPAVTPKNTTKPAPATAQPAQAR